METVTNDEVSNAFDIFCKEQGFDANKLTNALEFSMFIGFCLLNSFNLIEEDDKLVVPSRVPGMIAALNGPHGVTVVRVWRARRYSFSGKLKAFWLKPAHRLGFMLISFATFVREAVK